MASRITDKDLDILCAKINRLTNSPEQPYLGGKAQVGNFHINHAYGGVCLHRMHNESGGVSCPLPGYHEPKRALYEKMRAFIAGIENAAGA